ncbi:hypothetical protein BDR26DRAFT_372093 [Obelidium mucronatum]|nr:hypothetical protein BDR26DRAFT_372093 [Obelidium mucronatum]
MDLRGKYGHLSQPPPPPTGFSAHLAPLPTPKTKIARPLNHHQLERERTPSTNPIPQTRSRNPSTIQNTSEKSEKPVQTKAKKQFNVHPVTYDPTRPIPADSDEPPLPTTNKKITDDSIYPSLTGSATSSTTSTSKYFANLESSDEEIITADNSDFEEEKYMQMLSQYAEMSGMTFSAGFLAGFEDSNRGNNSAETGGSSLSSSLNGSYEDMDGLPVHRSRLPKDYKPNVVNPRPLMATDDPGIPLWPPFIKGIVEAPVHGNTCRLSQPEPFFEAPVTPTTPPTPRTPPPSQQPQQQQDPFTPKTVYESYYSIDQPLKQQTPTPTASLPLEKPIARAPSPLQFKVPALTFESRFECGNLAKAVRKGPTHYELYCRNDLNTAGHTQWYYFKVNGMVTRNEFTYEDIVYQFDIVNFCKPKTLYSVGLKPLLYSEAVVAATGVGWHRVGHNLMYHQSAESTQSSDESSPQEANGNQQSPPTPQPPPKYTLSFTIKFPHPNDTVYFAHCYPYSYTNLQTDIQTLKQDPERTALFRHSIMAKTVVGNNIDLLTVTKPVTTPNELVSRKGIILSARVHPGETNASWMIRGLIWFLTGASKEAHELRSRFVIKIVPMINPDGVIVGNYRCNMTGYDLNRQWTSAQKPSAVKAIPEIHAMYTLLERSVNSREVLLFCDFHGHNRKNGIFMYGCENVEPKGSKTGAVSNSNSSGSGRKPNNSRAASAAKRKIVGGGGVGGGSNASATTTRRNTVKPQPISPTTPSTSQTAVCRESQETLVSRTANSTPSESTIDPPPNTKQPQADALPKQQQQPTIAPARFMERVFPYILSKRAPDLFFFRRCQFKMQPSKRGTGRICVRTRFGIVNSFTIESSFCGSDIPVASSQYPQQQQQQQQKGGNSSSTGAAASHNGKIGESAAGRNSRGWHYSIQDLERMGEEFGHSLYEYFIVEGRREMIHEGLVNGFNNHESVLEPEESDDSETTSDDEILRIKIPKKKVLSKRQSASAFKYPIKKAPVGPERPRYNNRPVPITPPVVNTRTSVAKESINLSKVKVVDKGATSSDIVKISIAAAYYE